MIKEEKFLDCFLDKSQDYRRTYVKRPFLFDNYVIATNGNILVRIPYKNLKGLYKPDETIKRVPPIPEVNCSYILPLEVLIETIKSIPLVEEVSVEGKDAECDECGGSGNVYWVYEDSEGEEHSKYDDCPICDGRGKVKTKIIRRERRRISINGRCFSVGPLIKLAEAMNIAGTDSVEIGYLPDGCSAALFLLEDNIEILIMALADVKPDREIEI